MTKTEIILTIIGLINALVAALLSVFLSHHLQNKSKKRDDKLRILIDLMVSRIYGWTPNSVHSMNIIDIVFADSKIVKDAWHNYFNLCKVNNPSEAQIKDIEIAKNKLIEEIAINLGYKDKLTWNEIQSFYIPKGLDENLSKQHSLQEMQLQTAQRILSVVNKNSNSKQNNK
ncbi:MAG: hypothetical protein KIG16_00525 [Eubacteriales bacterium]|nr:hypothetical protein [Eubacteriales bacterium]